MPSERRKRERESELLSVCMQSVKITCSLGISTRNTHTSPLFLLFFSFFSILFSVSFPFVISFPFCIYVYVSIKNIDRVVRQIDKALNKHIFLGAKTNWIVVVARSLLPYPLIIIIIIIIIISQADGLICTHAMSFIYFLRYFVSMCTHITHVWKRHTVKSNNRNRGIEEERISSVVDGEYTSRRHRSLFNHHHL